MTLRPATPGDCAAIAAIWNPVIRDTLATFNTAEKTEAQLAQMIEARAAEGGCFLVADGGQSVCGFATYAQFRGGLGYAHTMEHTVILAPEAQGRGLGRALVGAIEDHARAGGAHSMFAGISSGNPLGLRFHAALGYDEAAVLRQVGWKFGQWLDLHLMQKML